MMAMLQHTLRVRDSYLCGAKLLMLRKVIRFQVSWWCLQYTMLSRAELWAKYAAWQS